ncbi:hypothetical protein AVMA1855_15810 [Acidovorax sp. SUPP1855]|uniref:hypothetical protein n=1 Tax=Acidovorax sp. SUPP1855 TaxID=431774 RepID=UPI0023DE21E2|nr:hypothetical protein [Acidovorax sp. SUPP1855]GKS85636.1 hypothetical protein AVMA1855_15810 [Acidovorax sp. SUPP1855]
MSTNYPTRAQRHRGLFQQFSPLNLAPAWEQYSVVKARGVRTIALGGHTPYSASGWVVEQAVGCIELIGAKVAGLGQMLLIGFTLSEQPASAGFEVTATDAIGTLILPAHCFAAYVAIAAGQNTHFRIGGNGQLNAIGSDPSSLQAPSPV